MKKRFKKRLPLTPPDDVHFQNYMKNNAKKPALTARINDHNCNNDVTFISPTFRKAQVPPLFVTNSGHLDFSTPPPQPKESTRNGSKRNKIFRVRHACFFHSNKTAFCRTHLVPLVLRSAQSYILCCHLICCGGSTPSLSSLTSRRIEK